MSQPNQPLLPSGTYREKTRARPTVQRVPIPHGARWIATDNEGQPLASDIQPHAKLMRIFATFIENRICLDHDERVMQGEYLARLHEQGGRLSVGNRIFVPVAANPFHPRELSGNEHQYPAVSICDGLPFKGPIIGLYSTRHNDDGEIESTLLNTHNTYARKGSNKRGTLGALLFGALETAGYNLWPHRYPWGTEAAEIGLRSYFETLQVIPGFNAGAFFALNWTKASLNRLEVEIYMANHDGHRAFGLLLLRVVNVVGQDLYLDHGYPCDRITITDSVQFPGWGRRFTSAFALVTYALTDQGFGFRDAFVMPVVSSHHALPSESSLEASALEPLLRWIDLENSRGARILLRKRLFSMAVDGRLVRPDAEIEDLNTTWRLALEVLGFPPDWKEYHSRKLDHATVLARAGFTEIRHLQAYKLKNPVEWHRGASLLLAAVRSSRIAHISGAKSSTIRASGELGSTTGTVS